MIRVALLAAVLAGCAAAPEVRQVSVPVPVPCVDEIPVRPALVSDADLRAMNDYQLVLALWRDRLQRAGYDDAMVAVLQACRVLK